MLCFVMVFMRLNNPVRIERKLPYMMKQDFIETTEFSAQQLLDMMNLGVALKASTRAGFYPALLKKKCIGGMLPDAPPLYRTALETACHQLGGHYAAFDLPLDAPGKLREAAILLSRTLDLAIIRCERHETLLALAKYAEIPIINAGSAYSQPVQEIADLITMFEHLPAEKKLDECKAVYAGGDDVCCSSTLYLCTKIGMQFVQFCTEKQRELKPPVLKHAERNVKRSGGTYTVTDSGVEAFRNADFLLMDAPLGEKVPPDAEGVLRIDPLENHLTAFRALLVTLLYENPADREPILVEKVKRTLAVKLQAIFGFGDAAE